MIRDGYKCKICGSKKKLEVHHIKHEASKPSEIITVCRRCHNDLHSFERALEKGGRSYFVCEVCNSRLLDYRYQDDRRILICPNCLNGVLYDGFYPRFIDGSSEIIKQIKDYLVTYKDVSFDVKQRKLVEAYTNNLNFFKVAEETAHRLYVDRNISVKTGIVSALETIHNILDEAPQEIRTEKYVGVVTFLSNHKNHVEAIINE